MFLNIIFGLQSINLVRRNFTEFDEPDELVVSVEKLLDPASIISDHISFSIGMIVSATFEIEKIYLHYISDSVFH